MPMVYEVAREQAAKVAQLHGTNDPFAIARAMDVEVFRGRMPQGTSGMIIKEAGEQPQIYLNESDAESRQRFTLAHELGHLRWAEI